MILLLPLYLWVSVRNLLMLLTESCLFLNFRFLRHRYEFLKNQPANIQPKVGFERTRNLEIGPPITKKEKSSRKREASLKPLAQAHDLNQRGGIYNGMEAPSQKSQLFFDINQKSRVCSKKEVTVHNSFPIFEQKERVCRAHEIAANTNMTPVFDLNQISVPTTTSILASIVKNIQLFWLVSNSTVNSLTSVSSFRGRKKNCKLVLNHWKWRTSRRICFQEANTMRRTVTWCYHQCVGMMVMDQTEQEKGRSHGKIKWP